MAVRTEIMGVTFDNVTLKEAVRKGTELAQGPGFSYVVTPNPEIVNAARADESYREILNGAAADAGSFHGIPDSGDSFHGIPGSASFRDIPGASYRSVPSGASGDAASIVAETLPADAEVVPAEPLPVRDAKGGGLFGRLRKH